MLNLNELLRTVGQGRTIDGQPEPLAPGELDRAMVTASESLTKLEIVNNRRAVVDAAIETTACARRAVRWIQTKSN